MLRPNRSRVAFLLLAIGSFFALGLVPISATAQSSGARRPSSDPQALSIVQSAISAMGGQSLWANVADVTIAGSCMSQDPDGGPTTNSQIHWIQAGNEFRYDATDSGGTATLVSGHGHPAKSDGRNTTAWSQAGSEAQRPYFVPALALFQDLNSQQYVFQSRPNTTLPGSTQPVIHIRAMKLLYGQPLRGTAQEWYFDPLTNLPIQVRYGIPGESSPSIQAQLVMQFSNYSSAQGFVTPQIFSMGLSTVEASACSVTSTNFNSSPPAATFDLPLTGGQQ